ncbi:MAG: cupin domain-containing protein [Lachnospiraceae bacterium]|nr:cupin domain-containing protein [Lachnospiraceae bacterium]MDD3615493.1 cupin domain-containing protein [Lachnospiraceae bacterium]
MAITINNLGAFPASGPQSREEAVFYKLSDAESIKMISGERTPALLSVWCSNDVMQFGTVKILTGGPEPQQTEFDSHAGDAVFFVLDGPLTFFIKDRKETYDVQPGDYMFIPEGETYKIINYYGKTARAIFAVAPEL